MSAIVMTRFLVVLLLCSCSFFGCSRPGTSVQTKAQTEAGVTPGASITQSCLDASKKVLGVEAEVVKCGRLTGTDHLEAVAVVRLRQFKETGDGIPVSKLVVIRQEKSVWNVELSVDKWIKNSAGYIGVEFIDDSAESIGYRVSFSDHRSDGNAGFAVAASYLHSDGQNESIPVEISWNPTVARFQEFSANRDPEGFQAEIKNPRHMQTHKADTPTTRSP